MSIGLIRCLALDFAPRARSRCHVQCRVQRHQIIAASDWGMRGRAEVAHSGSQVCVCSATMMVCFRVIPGFLVFPIQQHLGWRVGGESCVPGAKSTRKFSSCWSFSLVD